ncbi:MAG: S-methyl-5-thioribose-1-phosphate isomerase [Dechloromonas sp.]|uniref:Methylthioribose-1-phosphate isomerase n=1 Tax=Candidatus Dechloromonas phosphorivorans TaxID=2899244 RepID=A0A935K016_9RHOO|nr:S-methyl-5-thioribose-1-phosphate isomerase [Candidatus Dechloromonas phosphorivorans]
MNINGTPTRTLRAHPEQGVIDIIDQTRLPHALHWLRVGTLDDAAHAIRAMQVRGAPLIGATAAYGLAIALAVDASDTHLQHSAQLLRSTRPTAVNLHWALARMEAVLTPLPSAQRCSAAWQEASAIAEEDVLQNAAIGQHGLGLFRQIAQRQSKVLNIMTHCNIHVWVSETRPRNQGLLTAWELAQHGVPHTLISDNAAGILMRTGKVDAVIVGADRIAANGDVANKVGTYLKALACADNNVPFYVAAPRSTLDFACPDGAAIPIEEREGDEFRLVHGLDARGVPSALHQLPAREAVANPAFDVTPARLVTAIITERGISPASKDGLAKLYPESTHG